MTTHGRRQLTIHSLNGTRTTPRREDPKHPLRSVSISSSTTLTAPRHLFNHCSQHPPSPSPKAPSTNPMLPQGDAVCQGHSRFAKHPSHVTLPPPLPSTHPPSTAHQGIAVGGRGHPGAGPYPALPYCAFPFAGSTRSVPDTKTRTIAPLLCSLMAIIINVPPIQNETDPSPSQRHPNN